MPIRRYTRAPLLRGGTQYGTSQASRIIKARVDAGQIPVDSHILQQNERLDILAGQIYGDARLWWIIAAASGIGWGLQVPPGTRLLIPTDLSKINAVVG